MVENLVIVESPAKAKTIEKFLGKDFLVKSSFGHIRDLSKKNLGINLKKQFEPDYIVSEDKKKIVAELKKYVKDSNTVWLASDEDREGEAIAWHLSEVLGLDRKKTKRIVFNEITKEAILKAIKNPRFIDQNLVNAQQARRILDRLVGFELSPILWKKVKPSLSAGRVQSVAVRLLVEREREVTAFKSTFQFRVVAVFEVPGKDGKKSSFKAELPTRFNTLKETHAFLEKCMNAEFQITEIVTKPARKSPAAPFTTSTLQQEASRKLGYSVAQTMTLAQKLYEAGKITYMRTDSVNLSESAISTAKQMIVSEFGEKYSNPRQFKTKTKGAQEAHEAIRPTYLDKPSIPGSNSEKKLYELIWKRTVASQMNDAILEKTVATISISTHKENFVATGEVLKFDGFLKVYMESSDEEGEENEEGLLPPLKEGQKPGLRIITATQKFSHHPARYTEASLVKKLEELGIGRPSTYAPIISTIQQRGYAVKEDRPGTERKYTILALEDRKITETVKTENAGAEKAKLFPTDIGLIVNDFLMDTFKDILDFNFTALVEKEFDLIAEGNLEWHQMIDEFYGPFHVKVEETLSSKEKNRGERILGTDPESGNQISVKIGRFGPVVQIGDANDGKPRFASLLKGQSIETINLEEALDLFKLPRTVGQFEESEMVVGVGRFGPYVRHKNQFFSLKKDIDNPLTITAQRAVELILEKREKDKNKLIRAFSEKPGLQVLNGRYGPYINYNKENYKIPRGKEPASLSLEDCLAIIGEKDSGPAALKPKKMKAAAKAGSTKPSVKAKKPAKKTAKKPAGKKK
ncbi:MAG: type I DNA topoisomerase [Bacteroidales bacterium]